MLCSSFVEDFDKKGLEIWRKDLDLLGRQTGESSAKKLIQRLARTPYKNLPYKRLQDYIVRTASNLRICNDQTKESPELLRFGDVKE